MQDNPHSLRFPRPWTVEEVAEAYVVTDVSGTRLGFVYFDEASRGANSIRRLKPKALELAQAIAALPGLMQGERAREAPAPLGGSWTATDRTTWFTVDDSSGSRVCAVYVGHPEAGSLTWDEARRLANGVARLPVLTGTETPST
jgi:hypothetical protein